MSRISVAYPRRWAGLALALALVTGGVTAD
jgi:hypothetical protein